MSALTRAELRAFIARQRYGVVATVQGDGATESALVGIAVSSELEIYFDTLGDTRKAANLRRDPRVSFVIGWDNEQSVQLEGIADEPKGDDLVALKRIYYAAWPDGPTRESWPGITWFRIKPHWIRFSDFNRAEDIVRELRL
ncbi:MAG TPA: pyridoxamine 5'-phosphate oxidase family protein [Rhizomicrobium sp.]|nr:pyridoxamine 5'-phosphate oxidase family protein [Rhizomicrobium sp.]